MVFVSLSLAHLYLINCNALILLPYYFTLSMSSSGWCWLWCLVGHSCKLFATLWTVVHQAPLSTQFFRQEYWSGLPFHSPGHLPNSRVKPVFPRSPALQEDSLPTEPTRKPQLQDGIHSTHESS